MIKNQDDVWVFDPYSALVETSINNLDSQFFAVAGVDGNMLSPLFTQSMLGSGHSFHMFIPIGDDPSCLLFELD